VFSQQSLQPKLSRRRYASVSYVLRNNTVFRHAQNWVSVSDGSWTDSWHCDSSCQHASHCVQSRYCYICVCLCVCLSVCLSALLIKVAVTWCDCVTLTPEML